MNRLWAFITVLFFFNCLYGKNNKYFTQYTRQLECGWGLHQWVKQPLYVVNSEDSMPIAYYFVFKHKWYAMQLQNKQLYQLEKTKKSLLSKKEEATVLKQIAWHRKHNKYHGFVGWLTLILAIPSVLFLLLPTAMFVANFIVSRSTGNRIFHKPFKWWLVFPLLVLWFVEWWLCHYPQSF